VILGLNRVKTVFYEEKDRNLKLCPISKSFFSHKNIGEAKGVRLQREEFAQIFGVNETVVARAFF
jgi:hypothetical protein